MDLSLPLSSEVILQLRGDLRRDWFITENEKYHLKLEHVWSTTNPILSDNKIHEIHSIENPN